MTANINEAELMNASAPISETEDGLVTAQDIRLQIERLRKDMSAAKRDIIIWLGGAIIAATTIVINFMPVAAP